MKKLLATMVMMFCTMHGANAADNVLQGIQIDSIKDTYKIVLKSDEAVEMKKTVQAPNKLIIDLKGVRASKTINTVYNNAVSVDSVLVNPISEDSLRIFVQADNVSNAEVAFDTLKTPLGILPKSQPSKGNQLVLNHPMESYKPIYAQEEETSSNFENPLSGLAGLGILGKLKKALQDEGVSQIITTGLISIAVLAAIKIFKGEEKEVKIGLSQSLKDREIDLYKGLASTLREGIEGPMANISRPQAPTMNYGLKTYQNTSKNPYATPETMQVRRPSVQPLQQTPVTQAAATQRPIKTVYSASRFDSAVATKPVNKTCNVDSMKFLESMTKIYEKNGRADLAQGLKANMGKVKTRARA